MAISTKTVVFLVFVFAAAAPLQIANAEDHDVGDDTNWQVPTDPNFYATWASRRTFRVGDTLEFDFTTGAHNVAEVTKAAFEGCNTANPMSIASTGPATVALNATGERFFICAVPTHCSRGQKVAVNVVSANAPPTSAPTTPAPPGTPTTPRAPPPPSSASSLSAATFLIILLSSVVGLLW